MDSLIFCLPSLFFHKFMLYCFQRSEVILCSVRFTVTWSGHIMKSIARKTMIFRLRTTVRLPTTAFWSPQYEKLFWTIPPRSGVSAFARAECSTERSIGNFTPIFRTPGSEICFPNGRVIRPQDLTRVMQTARPCAFFLSLAHIRISTKWCFR